MGPFISSNGWGIIITHVPTVLDHAEGTRWVQRMFAVSFSPESIYGMMYERYIRTFLTPGVIMESMADEIRPIDDRKDDEDRLYESALESVLGKGKRDYPNYVGGFKVASGVRFPISSPVDRSIMFGSLQEPEDGLAERAVSAAKATFGIWSGTAVGQRIEIFDRVLSEIGRQRYRLAALVSLSVGMTRRDALHEVDRLAEIISVACDDIGNKAGSPYGVWAVLTAHNSPLAAPMGYACAAMIAGNTVVAIPSSHAPVPVFALYDIIAEAGLPDGVLNIIIDRNVKHKCTADIANNPDVAGVVAVGSGNRMQDLMFLQMDDELRFVNEIKGMNPILVYKPSNMKMAARMVLESAFSFAGQRLDSCSKVVVTENEQRQLTDAILSEAKNMRITDPNEPDAFAGPVISENVVSELEDLVEGLRGNLLFGGKRVKDELTENGCYVTPAIFVGLDEEHDLNSMDSALPVLSIQAVRDLDDAIDIINCTEYGQCAGIITRDVQAAERFVEGINADEIFINDSSSIIGTAMKACVDNFMG